MNNADGKCIKKKFKCYEVKIEESEKTWSQTKDTCGLRCNALPLHRWYCQAHTEWLPGVWLHDRVGGCLAVVAQWQSIGSSQEVSWVLYQCCWPCVILCTCASVNVLQILHKFRNGVKKILHVRMDKPLQSSLQPPRQMFVKSCWRMKLMPKRFGYLL